MSESFLSRWSRRKRESTSPRLRGEVDRRPPAAVLSDVERRREASATRSASGEGAAPPAARVEAAPPPDPLPASGEREIGRGEAETSTFDPTTLPPIESINAGTDVSAFLRPGVPADLAQAALRRAWVADPAIRDFVGLAENAWDFNKPGGVPGFEPLRAIDDVQRLAAQVAGVLPTAPAETAAVDEGQPTETSAQPEPSPPPQDAGAASEDVDAASQQKTSTVEHGPPRARHGGALAE
jgi:Protein of unknown function (DUF3306)